MCAERDSKIVRLSIVTLHPLEEFLDTIPEGSKRERMVEVLDWVKENYPQLGFRMGWSQPMFTNEGTFIVGFSAFQKHMNIGTEGAVVEHFEASMKERGIKHGKMTVPMPWSKPFNYELLGEFMDYQITAKEGVKTFWRPSS